MATLRQILTGRSTGAGRQVFEQIDAAVIEVLTETVAVTQFTDGGATAGTYIMAGSLPAGALVLGTKVIVPAGFAGDTTATLQIGDGSTVARFNTSTVNLFATAANGIDSGVPSGLRLLTGTAKVTLTVTSSADFTSVVSNGSGIVTVSILYVQTT
jgi:hypothetical protein